ncbi:MAG: VOC family protein [Alphaproteobacteria bacterium]|nr:VOC family protein [Alphaproteobacteria bacterium]
MIRTKGMVHFTIPVSDLARAKSFYCDLLGFDFIRESPRMVFCRSDDDYFVLTVSKTPIKPNEDGAVSIHHAFYVEPEEFDRAVAYLKDRGASIAKEETRGPEAAFGGRHCYFHDPDGNVLELLDPACGIAASKAGFYAENLPD